MSPRIGRAVDQTHAPILEALATIEGETMHGFGAPGHGQGAAIPRGLRRLIGRKTFVADALTPKGLDDRVEAARVLQRAHALAAEAWGADVARFVTGGSTQSLHSALAAVARPGETVLFAANVHKAERAYALAAGLDAQIVPVQLDETWDIEHGVDPATLTAALDAHPHARAFVLVSPSYHGVTSDITALAAICHARGIPLICDAAWGGAFAFCDALPNDPLAQGADIAVYSLHKTMGALAQGSVLAARAGLVEIERLWLAFELFETTSPSVPILASLDAARREHALDGQRIWRKVLARAERLRAVLAVVDGLRLLTPADLPPGAELDATKVLVDTSALGVSAYAIDDWLAANHKVSVGLSDARHLLAAVTPGTSRADIGALARGLADCVSRLRSGKLALLPLGDPPRIGTLSVDMAMEPTAALFAPAEQVPLDAAAGRIAAELIAPAPPGVPRLVPGQCISPAHVRWLAANRDLGAFFLDPIDQGEGTIRVVRDG